MTYRNDDLTLQESIDLLVDGELDHEARRALLARLDTEAEGWKRCAVAFLEAQAWRGSMPSYRNMASVPARPSVVRTEITSPVPIHRRVGWLARAAVILMAFGLGWITRPSPRIVSPSPTASRTDTAAPPEPPSAVASAEPDPAPPPPSYLRGRLQREGYQVEKRVFLVPGSSPDGRPVTVPVEQVKVRFVGNRSV